MLWLIRPPYLRWLGAATLLVGALAFDLHERSTEPYPFVDVEIPAGTAVDADDVTYVDVPVGLLGIAGTIGATSARSLQPGDPWMASAAAETDPVPAGWWSIPVDLPVSSVIGQRVRLVSTQPQLDVEGVVTAPPATGAFAVATTGLVAVPPGAADSVAVATAAGALVVMLSTS